MYPKTAVQLCIIHLVRHCLNYVGWKQCKDVAADLKRIYQSATAEEAEAALRAFETTWSATHPSIGQSWRRRWPRVIPFFDYPPEIRKVIYTTNAIEPFNMSLPKSPRNTPPSRAMRQS